MRLWDTPTGYGWISIILHWVTAIAITVLLYTGAMSQLAEDPLRLRDIRATHMTVAFAFYLLLWARVIFRLYAGHPGASGRQHRALLVTAKYTHYVMVIAIGAMLVSGPLLVLFSAGEFRLFDLAVPSPLAEPIWPVYNALRWVHALGGTIVFVLVLLHIVAVVGHVAVMRDGSFDRIVVAQRDGETNSPESANTQRP